MRKRTDVIALINQAKFKGQEEGVAEQSKTFKITLTNFSIEVPVPISDTDATFRRLAFKNISLSLKIGIRFDAEKGKKETRDAIKKLVLEVIEEVFRQ